MKIINEMKNMETVTKKGRTTGRVNGMYNWRLGWRADVLRLRQPESSCVVPPLMPIMDALGNDFSGGQLGDIPFESRIESAWSWWKDTCKSPKFIAGPMIGQSERCFRLQCRTAGAQLCYTPMYVASDVNSGAYDEELLGGCNPEIEMQDRPLICQLAGNNVEEMLAAARRVQPYYDAIDINLGCPQRCADLGHYGSFLLERDVDLVCNIVAVLSSELDIPVTAKMRLQGKDVRKTIEVARRLEQAGVYI